MAETALLRAHSVSQPLRTEVDSLIQACATADGFLSEIYTDASINAYKDMASAFFCRRDGLLVGLLFIFSPTAEEIEVSALVHPDCRKQGLFRAMLGEAAAESQSFGYRQGLLVCNEKSAAALKIAERWGLALSRVEYQMRYGLGKPAACGLEEMRLETVTPDEVKALAPLMARTFDRTAGEQETYLLKNLESSDRMQWKAMLHGQVVGFCGAYLEGHEFNIFGLGVLPEEQRKGYARAILNLMESEALKAGADALRLDVDSDNPPALSLYRSYGFECLSATCYYGFDLKAAAPCPQQP